ncbi:hypothetical protein K457DRAFT_12430 [Linnemannia elongata AG-77]|uniref:Uncharacterized protein n=1 Tax=Linnemannia elongata AG-77 TaxID=1314771 RepID=A0A197KJM8_9FUNG|nr:hypothetical protein K457DRAFT_12430 [Linnemannia elongata AG-77]
MVLAGMFIGFDCQPVHVLPFLSHLTVLLMETVLDFQMRLKTAFRACPFLQEVVLRRKSSYGNPDPFLESGDDGDPEAWSGAAAVGGFAARSIAGDIQLGITPATVATSTLLLLPMLKNLHLSVETKSGGHEPTTAIQTLSRPLVHVLDRRLWALELVLEDLAANNSRAFTVERDANKDNAYDCAGISDATSTAPIVYYE